MRSMDQGDTGARPPSLKRKDGNPGSAEMESGQASSLQRYDVTISQIKTVIQIPVQLGYVMGAKTVSPEQSRHLVISTG